MRTVADEQKVSELIDALAERLQRRLIAERDTAWALVGIRSRGDDLARRLAERLKLDRVGTLDITLYRDDLSEVGPQPVVRTTEVPFDLDGVNVILVDDVLMTGRSIRAALQSLMDLGRPRRVWLSVLVDRGGRELPIAADDAAITIDTLGPRDRVKVQLTPTDEKDAIYIVGDRTVAGEGSIESS